MKEAHLTDRLSRGERWDGDNAEVLARKLMMHARIYRRNDLPLFKPDLSLARDLEAAACAILKASQP